MEPDQAAPPVKNQPVPAKVKALLMAVIYKIVKLLCGKKLEGRLERVRPNTKIPQKPKLLRYLVGV